MICFLHIFYILYVFIISRYDKIVLLKEVNMAKSYVEYICDILQKEDFGKPIYVHEISEYLKLAYSLDTNKASAATSVAFKRILDGKLIPDLRFYQKGIYYRVKPTPFGETGIDKEQLILDKYLKDDNGYETGPLILHKLGLTSQMPNQRIVVTNNAKDCQRTDEKLGVIVRPCKVNINNNNKHYLEILDVLDIMDKTPIDVNNPYDIIGKYIKELGLDWAKLLGLAYSYYNKNTILQLAHVAKGQL